MMNKRAQFFGVYLVFLTLFFCGVSIMLFFVVQKDATNSLVSPVDVLKAGDSLNTFELFEKDMIKDARDDTKNNFKDNSASNEEFESYFREQFLEKISGDSFMREFLLRGLVVDGNEVEDTTRRAFQNFLENVVYPESLMKYDGSVLSIGRGLVGKSFVLKAEKTDKINFPVRFNFEFSAEYSVDENGEVTKI